MISVIRVFYKDTPVMFKKEGRFPKHVAFLDEVEGLPNSPILWGVCYIMQIPSMEEITRMMSNVTSAVCGRALAAGVEQGSKGKSSKPFSKKGESTQLAKARDTLQLRKTADTPKSLGKKPISSHPRWLPRLTNNPMTILECMICSWPILHCIISSVILGWLWSRLSVSFESCSSAMNSIVATVAYQSNTIICWGVALVAGCERN